MSHLIVITFEDTVQATQALESLKEMQKGGHLTLDDAAVIVKQESGAVEVRNQLDRGVKWGALTGGALGLLLAGVFFPLAGLAIGAAGGALVGKSLDIGVDQEFVREVTSSLKPGSSALFVVGSSGEPAVVIAALRPYEGAIYQTDLSSETVEALQDALKKRGQKA